MKKVTDFNVNNKTVILRCDLNVSINNDKIIIDDEILSKINDYYDKYGVR